jgi:leader peptidase (prepilin peptidase)/N-methyltransferase
VAVPDWIWFIFVFAFGCCIGSFLNVVIYRLPRDKSLITPGSSCPACGERIHFYDNIPLVSWILLGRKCRFCKAPISARYFIIELLTALVFLGLFILYFDTDLRDGLRPFLSGGWFIYLISIVLLGAFIAASAIDLEHWVIPLSICWFVTGIGLVASSVGVYILHPSLIRAYSLLPSASADAGALAIGAAIGLAISWVLVATGLVKRSYESVDAKSEIRNLSDDSQNSKSETDQPEKSAEPQFNHRLEVCREIVFLLPVFVCSAAAFWIIRETVPIALRNSFPTQHPVIAGLLGSMWGYFVGCGIVWVVRILGTLAFGREAMGLGDVHLMGAAGAVVGPLFVVVAFFIAPFFGLAWAGSQMFFKKIRQIPYGPFLSLGVFAVMILHDWIRDRISFMFYR